MQVDLNNPEKVKQSYKDGPGKQPELSIEELRAKRIEQEKTLDEVLPFLKKQEEYNRIQMSLMEMDALMGRIPLDQVPGVLGMEIKVREISAQYTLFKYMEQNRKAAEDIARNNQMSDEEKKAYEEFMKLSPEEQEKHQQEAIRRYQESMKQDQVKPTAQA